MRPCHRETTDDPLDLVKAATDAGRFVFANCDVCDPALAKRTVELAIEKFNIPANSSSPTSPSPSGGGRASHWLCFLAQLQLNFSSTSA